MDEFLRLNPGARAINADRSIYEVPIRGVGLYGGLALHVILPVNFPERPPLLQATSKIFHPWVDNELYLSRHPQLTASGWSAHANLGQIVFDVVQEWGKNPPGQPEQQIAANPPQPSPAPFYNDNGPPSGSAAPALVQIPSTFDSLDFLSLAELEVLATDSRALEEFLHQLSPVENVLKMKAELFSALKDSADAALAKKEEYFNYQEKLPALRSELLEFQQGLLSWHSRQLALLQRFSPANTLKALEEKMNEEEQKAEFLREQYESIEKSSELSPEDRENEKRQNKFVDSYLKQRQSLHEIAGKREIILEKYGKR